MATATCQTGRGFFQFNAYGQDACTIYTLLQRKCDRDFVVAPASDAASAYLPPHTPCGCNIIAYNLMAGCAQCQDLANTNQWWLTEGEWSGNCTSANVAFDSFGIPASVSQNGISIPLWAMAPFDTSFPDIFPQANPFTTSQQASTDANNQSTPAATNSRGGSPAISNQLVSSTTTSKPASSSSTSLPTTISSLQLGLIIGGGLLGLLILGSLLVFYLRKRGMSRKRYEDAREDYRSRLKAAEGEGGGSQGFISHGGYDGGRDTRNDRVYQGQYQLEPYQHTGYQNASFSTNPLMPPAYEDSVTSHSPYSPDPSVISGVTSSEQLVTRKQTRADGLDSKDVVAKY